MQKPTRTTDMGTPGAAGSHAVRLRALGQRLDAERLHSIAIIETDDGYIVRASHPDHRRPVLIEAPHAQPPAPSRLAPASGTETAEGMPLLCRNGYATALYALGCRLDRRHATAIAINEGEHFVAVCLLPAGASTPREELFLADDLTQLIAQAQQAAHLPETATRQTTANAHPIRRTPEQRRPSYAHMSRLHRLAARLMSGVKQQPGA